MGDLHLIGVFSPYELCREAVLEPMKATFLFIISRWTNNSFPVEDILQTAGWSNVKHCQNFMTYRLTALVRPVTCYLTRHRRMWYPMGFEISLAP